MIRKGMINFGRPAPMQNSMNFKFGAEEPDPLGTFRSRFTLGNTDPSIIPTLASEEEEKEPRKFKATEALMNYINSMPKREDNQLGKWGKVGSALAAAATGYVNGPEAGIRTGQELRDRKYTQAMQDYANKGQGLKLAADLEADMYGKDLDFRKFVAEVQDKQAGRELDRERLGLDRDKYTTQQQQWREEFEQKKEAMIAAGWKDFIDKDGNMKLINTKTKEERNLGPSIEGPKLRVSAVTANAAARNATTNAGRLEEEIRSNQNREFNDATDIANRVRNTNSLIDTRAKGDLSDPLDELRLQTAAAKELALDPKFTKYVNEDGTLNMEMVKDNSWGWGTNEQELIDFSSALQAKINEMRTRRRGQAPAGNTNVIKLPSIPKPEGF